MAQYTPSAIKPLAGALPDDGDLDSTLPKICVDYLSHQWKEEDVWRSWRSMTRFKYEIANGMRLENASWRTWWKQRNKLKTISPETLNWLKDSDVTWLYGPLHQAPSAVPPEKHASTADKLGVDMPIPRPKQEPRSPPPPFTHTGSSSQAKPILKRRSVTDILAAAIVPPRTPQHTSSPMYETVTAELTGEEGDNVTLESDPSMLPLAAGVLQASSRPPLWHTKSDSILARASMGVTLSTSPMNIQRLSPPGDSAIVNDSKSASLSPPEYGTVRNGRRSDSSSSYQVSDDSATSRIRPKRISFNSFVEQRIVIDPTPTRLSTVHSSSDSGSEDDDEEDEDTILQMRSSSGSSLSSSRRGSNNSQPSSVESPMRPQMTMITAPIAPTLLKEPDDLPASSPAVVFVAPHGVDEEALKFEVNFGSRTQFAVADRKRIGEGEWSPNSSKWSQDEMVDYFSGVPLNGEPVETPRESIYTDEDEDAITIRRRKGGLRSPQLPRRELMSPNQEYSSPPETVHPVPRRSSFAKRSQPVTEASPPTVRHQEVAGSRIGKPLVVPRRTGSSSDIQFNGGYGNNGSVGSNTRSTPLSASMRTGRSAARKRAPVASSFEGMDMAGHTSALSGRAGSESALFSPPREVDLADTRGRSQRIAEETDRPRRGRSLLRTGSSSTISERERSSTTGSSSPLGSLSPRSSSSVGIVGGYIVPPSGIGAVIIPSSGSVRSSSSLRFDSGSWSAEEEHGIDGGDLAQVTATKPKPPSGGLMRVSSSSNVAQTSTQSTPRSGIRRTNSSTNVTSNTLQRTSSSSNIFSTTQQTSTPLITNVPTVTLQPPSSHAFDGDLLANHGPESANSSWRAHELEVESPPSSPSPTERVETPGDFEEPSLHHELSLAKNSIKPRASGMSLASNGSNESSATVVPKTSQAAKRRSSQLASASSSVSSTTSMPSLHHRSGSKSSASSVAGPATSPMAIRPSSSSRQVTQAVATRSEVGSAALPPSRRHLRKLSGGMSAPTEDKAPSFSSSPVSVSPGSVLNHVVGSAKSLFDALWASGDQSG